MAKREFMQLAHKYDAAKHGIGGWYMSEKLDGQRAFWDGGITRGMLKSDVPWANCAKDSRYLVAPKATGLWSRYGNVIHAPDSFLSYLPNFPLDGELYVEGDRQRLRTIISRLEPNELDWEDVTYWVFDSPPLPEDGVIKTTNFKKEITGCAEFVEPYGPRPKKCFHDTLRMLVQELECSARVQLLPQTRLPMSTSDAEAIALEYLNTVTDRGGEGAMLREAYSFWKPERTHSLVKMKKLDDMEGTVIGYTTGRKTDLGSKLLGKMGALVLELPNGKRLELSGFTDAERTLGIVKSAHFEDGRPDQDARDWATENPEAELPEWAECMLFPRGSKVTFRYRGLTNDGIPNEARYWRKYDAV